MELTGITLGESIAGPSDAPSEGWRVGRLCERNGPEGRVVVGTLWDVADVPQTQEGVAGGGKAAPTKWTNGDSGADSGDGSSWVGAMTPSVVGEFEWLWCPQRGGMYRTKSHLWVSCASRAVGSTGRTKDISS